MWKREMPNLDTFHKKVATFRHLDSLKPFTSKALAFSGIPHTKKYFYKPPPQQPEHTSGKQLPFASLVSLPD
jgi:hypothetical protein